MTINDQIRDEKPQYNINREAAKVSALSSGKIHKSEYLTGEDILPSNQQQVIEQAKFTYSPLREAFAKQIKTIEDKEKNKQKRFKIKDKLKQLKSILMMMMMILHLSQNKKYLMDLYMKCLKK